MSSRLSDPERRAETAPAVRASWDKSGNLRVTVRRENGRGRRASGECRQIEISISAAAGRPAALTGLGSTPHFYRLSEPSAAPSVKAGLEGSILVLEVRAS